MRSESFPRIVSNALRHSAPDAVPDCAGARDCPVASGHGIQKGGAERRGDRPDSVRSLSFCDHSAAAAASGKGSPYHVGSSMTGSPSAVLRYAMTRPLIVVHHSHDPLALEVEPRLAGLPEIVATHCTTDIWGFRHRSCTPSDGAVNPASSRHKRTQHVCRAVSVGRPIRCATRADPSVGRWPDP